jgi:LPXTG-motif cell wall-anchored protein
VEPDKLPTTGSNSSGILLLGGMVLLAGLALVAIRRPRRRLR